MWIYYSAVVLLFGAEFTQVYSRHTGEHIEPDPYAVKVAQVEVRFEGTPPSEKPDHSGEDFAVPQYYN